MKRIRWSIEKLLRKAWYQTVSKELDRRMESLFSEEQIAQRDTGHRLLPSGYRWRLAFGGIAAGLAVITGLTWFLAGGTPGRETVQEISDISGSSERNEASEAVERQGILMNHVFTSDRVILRSAYTASEMDSRIVLKKRIINRSGTEETL